ncbi:hypothetical protein CARUB_v10015979mg [Capsella rubella]|uniref:Knottin scorpion toxin-like domain-containing protein n=1 Tax=Capsella rubella TaxID=81985 RepID=R0GAT2_9BRAS|nr:hypothetical protein CARUB_v10015979mg [Capsella rubella]
MKNVSLKISLLVFILVITSNLGAEARELRGVDEKKLEGFAGSSSYAGGSYSNIPCKRDFDCVFTCPKDGICNVGLNKCWCF